MRIVGKPQDGAVKLHAGQKTILIVVIVVMTSGAGYPFGSQTVRIVGHAPGGSPIGHIGKLPPTLPGIGPGAIIQRGANFA